MSVHVQKKNDNCVDLTKSFKKLKPHEVKEWGECLLKKYVSERGIIRSSLIF